MAKSRAELAERVLKLLGVLGAGQEIEVEDQQTADAQIDPVLAELASRRILYTGDTAEFEDDIFNPLAECVAVSLATEYGADLSALIDPQSMLPRAEDRLRKITRQTGSGSMLKTDELTGISANWRGRTGWYNGIIG